MALGRRRDPTQFVDEVLIAEVLAQQPPASVFNLTAGRVQQTRLHGGHAAPARHRPGRGDHGALQDDPPATAPSSRTRSKPTARSIFASPTGIGKLQLAQALAEGLFETRVADRARCRISIMSAPSRVLRCPCGVRRLRRERPAPQKGPGRDPFGVVFFDEIKKAPPNIFDSLLQILEEIHLTDIPSRSSVSSTQCMPFMTTNLGARNYIAGGQVEGRVKADGATSCNHVEGRGPGRAEAALRPRVPEPRRRHHSPSAAAQTPAGGVVDLSAKHLAERLLATT